MRVQTISRLNKCLEDLFLNPTIVKLGFKAAPDFERLACSFPALPCFRRIISVLDTCTLAQLSIPELIKSKQLSSSVLQGQSLKQLGLSRLCSLVLDGKGLDKTQQCSGWHLRPLTPEQVFYFLYIFYIFFCVFHFFGVVSLMYIYIIQLFVFVVCTCFSYLLLFLLLYILRMIRCDMLH